MQEFFTVDRQFDLAEDTSNFVAAVTARGSLQDLAACERVEMLEDACSILDQAMKAQSWSMQALDGHPHGKSFVASMKADLTKSIVTSTKASDVENIAGEIADILSKCLPCLFTCPGDLSKNIVECVGKLA
eukprot:6577497-Pyramimonas_sp.AAC.1